MSFKDYLIRAERRYRYRIKTTTPLDSGNAPLAGATTMMDRVEAVLDRYLLVDMSSPIKTPIQSCPPDFEGVRDAEVYILDVTLGLPASAPELRRDLANALYTHERNVVVRGEGEPTELETRKTAALAEIDAEALKRGLTPAALLDDADFGEMEEIDGSELYGAKRNSALLGYLKSIQQEREKTAKVQTKSPLFAWTGAKVEVADDFNADIKDAPKAADKAGSLPKDPSRHEDTVRRAFVDANGKRVVLTRRLKDEG